MITNFEFYTKDISIEDIKNVNPLIDILSKTSANKQVLTPNLVISLNAYPNYSLVNRPIVNGRKIRKLVNYIRSNGLAPIIATSDGYYLSKDAKEIQDQINSLRERASSINACANGLERLLKEMQ